MPSRRSGSGFASRVLGCRRRDRRRRPDAVPRAPHGARDVLRSTGCRRPSGVRAMWSRLFRCFDASMPSTVSSPGARDADPRSYQRRKRSVNRINARRASASTSPRARLKTGAVCADMPARHGHFQPLLWHSHDKTVHAVPLFCGSSPFLDGITTRSNPSTTTPHLLPPACRAAPRTGTPRRSVSSTAPTTGWPSY